MITDDYRKALEEMHQVAPWGTKGFKYSDDVSSFYAAIGATSILDYGCGQQTLASSLPGLDVRGYDPGIPELAGAPVSADLVVTTDVLEHVEPDHIDEVIEHVFALAGRGVFHHIALTPAKRFLPDGRNAHLIVQPASWWLKKFENWSPDFRLTKYVPGRKTLKVWFTPVII